MSKAKTFFRILQQIFSAVFKLLMLGVYLLSRITEGISKILAKISEKFIE